MTLSHLERRHHRPLRSVLLCSAAALALSLGGGGAVLADDDDRDRDHRGWRDGDRDRDHDRGRGHDHDRYRGGDGRYWRDDHRDSGRDHRYGDRYRGDWDRDDYHYRRPYGAYSGPYYDRGYDRGYARPFVVPRSLYGHHYRDYDRYFHGSVFYAPHHHHHRVYSFPVIVNGYVQYLPHAYCGDAFYPGHYGGGARFDLHFNF